MADAKLLDKIAEELRLSPLLKRPMGYYQAPVSTTDTALSHLFQTDFVPRIGTEGVSVDVRVKLTPFEMIERDHDVESLEPRFAEYVNGGTSPLGEGTYISRDGWWKPERYALQATFNPNVIKTLAQVKTRLTYLSENMVKQGPILLLDWSKICAALESLELVIDETQERSRANLYQAVTNAQGVPEMWVAALPRLPEGQRPDENKRIRIAPDNKSGVTVRLTALWLANLLYLAQGAGVVEDGLNFAKSYYVARKPETAASLRKEIDELEFQLREAREKLAALEEA